MKKSLICGLLALLACLPLTSCAALLFPERQHAEHSGRLDPNILVLNGVGLLFFVIPGLVAFGVDFATGGIYLPEGVTKGEGPFFHDREVKVTVVPEE
jgi:hypothetical protein